MLHWYCKAAYILRQIFFPERLQFGTEGVVIVKISIKVDNCKNLHESKINLLLYFL